MRLSIELTCPPVMDSIILPLHYNRALQGLIYSLLKEDMPEIHDQGYSNGERNFRLFVFSRLFGRIKELRDGTISFFPPIRFKVDSIINGFVEVLADKAMKADTLRLGSNDLVPAGLSIEKAPDVSAGVLRVKAISPITVYSTLTGADGKKKTYYYHPSEKEFPEQIKQNLIKKAGALGMCLPADSSFNLRQLKIRNTDQKIIYYGNYVIKGWLGLYELTGSPDLINLAYTTGIGAKNAQGFGMLETIR